MNSRAPVGSTRRRFTSIPQFSDRPSLPRVAKLRLGIMKKGSGGEHPSETDHFILDVVDAVAPSVAKEITERFKELYGERPQTIHDVMVVPIRDEAFSSAYEKWGAGKLRCTGNGDEATRKNEDGEWIEWNPCANGGCPDYQAKKCSMQTRLRVLLPQVTIIGYFQIDTGSIYGTANIRDGISLAESLAIQVYGAPLIHKIPMMLTRASQNIEFGGKLNEHFIIHLTPQNFTLESLKQLAAAEAAAPKQIAAALDIVDTEEDLPAEQVPISEQAPINFDPELEKRIVAGFARLQLNAGTQAAMRSQLPDQEDLIEELERQWFALPKDERAKRKAAAA